MKKVIGAVFVILVIAIFCLGQSSKNPKSSLSVWSVHSPDVLIQGRSPYPVGVLTPAKSIVVRRVEALSNRGPSMGSTPGGEPIPCPVQYTLELTNGVVTQTVPISNAFVGKKTSQTYTDSGTMNLEFPAGNRITVSMVAPKPQFPPVDCNIMGLDVTIQYELAEEKPAAPAEGQ